MATDNRDAWLLGDEERTSLGLQVVDFDSRDIWLLGYEREHVTQAISPSGFETADYGAANVTHPGILTLSGFDSSVYGSAEVKGSYTLSTVGLDSEATGTAAVTFLSTLAVPGIVGGELGGAIVAYAPQTVTTSGLDSFVAGTAAIDLLAHYLIPPGLDSAVYGNTANVRNARETVRALSLLSQVFGTAFVENSIRTVVLSGSSTGGIGTALASLAVRAVSPQPLAGVVGVPGVGRHQTLDAAGFEDVLFGDTLVHDNSQSLHLVGFGSEQTGTAWLSRSPRVLAPAGVLSPNPDTLPSEQWGWAYLFNSTQIVGPYSDDTEPVGGIFGRWLEVANRNRGIGVYGINSARYGNGANLYKGPVIDPGSFDGTEFGTALVADAVRSLGAETFEGYVSPWAAVFTNGQPLPLPGIPSAEAAGIPLVANNRRYYDHIGGFDSFDAGAAFVADAVRTVTVYYAPGGFPVPEPDIGLFTRSITPDGIGEPDGRWGATAVQEHHSIITPRWPTRLDVFGGASLRNLTPELHVFGHEDARAGTPYVGLFTRLLSPPGLEQTGWGYAVIRDLRTWLTAGNIGAPLVTQAHSVLHIPPDTRFPQTAFAHGVQGVVSNNATVESTIRAVKPSSAQLSTAFGSVSVISTGIDLTGKGAYLPDEEQYGLPTVVSYQTITVSGWRAGVLGEDVAVSPFWIYPSAPGAEEFTIIPQPTVTNQNRAVQVAGFGSDAYGIGGASFRVRRVYPLGIASFRRGFPKIPGELKAVARGFGSSDYGAVAVGFGDTGLHGLAVAGLDAGQMGTPRVDLTNRAIPVIGPTGAAFGLARVHPPEPVIAGGMASQAVGIPWLSFRVRGLDLQGFDASVFGAGSFNRRMVVKRGQPIFAKGFNGAEWGMGRVSTNPQTIGCHGLDSGVVRNPTIQNKTQVIGAYPPLMFGPQFGKAGISHGE